MGLRLHEISVIGIHTALGGFELWRKQVDAIAGEALKEQERGQKVVICGDWNETEGLIFKQDSFARLNLISVDRNNTPTCPTSLPKFLQKSLDHIFVPDDWHVVRTDYLAFGSDHLAVLADVVPSAQSR